MKAFPRNHPGTKDQRLSDLLGELDVHDQLDVVERIALDGGEDARRSLIDLVERGWRVAPPWGWGFCCSGPAGRVDGGKTAGREGKD